MEQLSAKKELIDAIRIEEGARFECDETAILKEYELLNENKSSLAIKVLTVVGGIIATLSFIGFLALTGLYNSEVGTLVFGALFLIVALLLNIKQDKLIIDTFSISLFSAGLIMFAFGLSQVNVNENTIALIVILVGVSSLVLTQNYVISFIAVLIISGGFFFLIVTNNLFELIPLYTVVITLLLSYFYLNEAKILAFNKKVAKLYNPVRISLLFSFIASLILSGSGDFSFVAQSRIWISSLVLIALILYLVYLIILKIEIETIQTKLLIYTLTSLILFPTIFSPSIPGSLVIILLSFLVNYKTGLAIGILAFLFFIVLYYYNLNLTLLTKSIVLFSSGIVFLLFYLFTALKLRSNEKI